MKGEAMKENRMFGYIDRVELSRNMKNKLIECESPFIEAKPMHRRGFAVLAGMAAVLCGVVIGGYVFLMDGDFQPPPPPPEIESSALSEYGHECTFISDSPALTTAVSDVPAFPARSFLDAPAPASDRGFWYSDLYGHEYILDILASLEYHGEFADYARRNPLTSEEADNTVYDIEQFIFDFLEYVAMPLVLISEPESPGIAKEQIRAREIDSTILALGVARAFVEGNMAELESLFAVDTPGLFDFVKAMGFREFTMLGTEFDPVMHEHLHYFLVIEDNRWENVFTDERIWILRTDGHQIQQFAPDGENIARVNVYTEQFGEDDYDKLIRFCYFYSTLYLLQPEDTQAENIRGLFAFMDLGYEYTNFNEGGRGYFTAEEFIEHVEYVYGIELGLSAIIASRAYFEDENGEILVTLHAGGYSPTRAELIEISEIGNRSIRWFTLNFYGDAGYMFLAKTIRFELTAGQSGWRLVSAETIYDNPDVNVAFIHY
jgi:hypothetical protein